MASAFVLVVFIQMLGFGLLFWQYTKHSERVLNESLAHLKAKSLEEVAHVDNVRKTYDVQLAHMKDNLAKEQAQIEQQRVVKDELSGQMVDLSQYDIL